MSIRTATQEDVTAFYAKAMMDDKVAPYLFIDTHIAVPTLTTYSNGWYEIYLVNDQISCLGHVSIDRAAMNDVTISIFALDSNRFNAGRMIKEIERYLKQINPRSINGKCAESNEDSYNMLNKMLGRPWGIEERSTYNSITKTWEGCWYFIKVIY